MAHEEEQDAVAASLFSVPLGLLASSVPRVTVEGGKATETNPGKAGGLPVRCFSALPAFRLATLPVPLGGVERARPGERTAAECFALSVAQPLLGRLYGDLGRF